MTLLKLALTAKWCLAVDFLQGIIVLLYLGPDLVLGPRPCNLVKVDGLGLDFILGPDHVTLQRLKDRALDLMLVHYLCRSVI